MKIQCKIMGIVMILSILAVTACNDDGSGNSGGTAPSAPGPATITTADSRLILSWTAVDGATAYEVWYHTGNDSSSAAQDSGDIAGTSHTITGLTNGTTYYVWLKANNSWGTSGFGPAASGTPSESGTSDTFGSAADPGDAVTVTTGSTSFKMIYANNQTDITFPIYVNNTGTETLTRRFFMGETEVTNSLMVEVLQWAYDNWKISEGGTDNLVDETTVRYGGRELVDLDSSYIKISYSTVTHEFSVESGYENHPVTSVKWYGAVMFCNWLTEMIDGNSGNLVYSGIDTTWDHEDTVEDPSKTGYRLPSWQEWQFAAKYIGRTAPTDEDLASECVSQNVNSGDPSLTAGYYWTPGNYASGAVKDTTNIPETQEVAVYKNDYSEEQEVKSLGADSANQLGLYDMSGNVFEWCFSLNGDYRVVQGGSWDSSYTYVQVGYYLADFDPDSAIVIHYGFRLAKTK